MKCKEQIRCPECGVVITHEYEKEIKGRPRTCLELFVRLFDSKGYETVNVELVLDVEPDVDVEKLKKRKKLLNRLALDYARLKGYKASFAEVESVNLRW